MGDFRLGQARFLMCLQLKLSFWDALPHKLAGCSHDNQEQAQACALECLALWQDMTTRHPLSVHPLLVKTFQQTQELEQFANGGQHQPLRAFPALTHLIELRLCCVLELAVESAHALVKQRVKKNHT